MLRAFFSWWFGELRGLLPGAARDGELRGPVVRFDIERGRLEAHYLDGARREHLGACGTDEAARQSTERHSLALRLKRLDPTRTRCEVRVDAPLTLVNEVALPAATAENLREVVGFQIEQLSPFRADDVYFEHVQLERGRADEDRIGVRFALTRRRIVDAALGLLPDWSFEQQPLAAAAPAGEPLTLRFVPRRFREHRGRGLFFLLALVCIALLAAAVTIPLRQQAQTVAELEDELNRARRAAGVTAELQDQLVATQSRLTEVRSEALLRPPRVLLVEELSRLLPDHTVLSRMELRGTRLDLRGNSTAASSLIGVLEASPMLEGVSFGSPVVADRGGAGERFHLTARVVLPGGAS